MSKTNTDLVDPHENIRKIATAFIEAAAPEFRMAINGKEVSEERFNKEFEYQLRARNVGGLCR